MQGHVDYLLDPGRKLGIEDVTRPDVSARFQPVQGRSADFGYTGSVIWLRFSVTNPSPSLERWRLLFRENFLQLFTVYLVGDDGSFETLANQDADSPFSARPLSYPQLAVPMVLPAGVHKIVYVRYWSGGSSALAFSIELLESFEAIGARATAKNFVYYGMMLILILIALFAFAIVRRPVFLAYAGYSGSALLFIMHADGSAFKFLWPDAPHFNSNATIVLGSGIILFGAVYAMLFLQTRRYHPLLDKSLAAVVLVTLAMLFASALLNDQQDQQIKKILVLVAFAAILLFVLAGLVAARTRFKQVRFYVIAWTGAVISSAIMTARHWLGIEISEEVQFDSMRIVMVLDAALMGLAIWDHFNQLRQARHQALKENLDTTMRSLELSQRLQDLEEQYALVCRLADMKGRRITDAIHDLNQPLHALRLDLRGLVADHGTDSARRKRIEGTFDYLETLLTGHLDRAIAMEPVPPATEADEGTEKLAVGDVLKGIHEMFLPDAAEKALELRYVGTSAQAAVEPLVLMRIVTNLVANAIKYTRQGRVLLGCRRDGRSLRIEVHDTGPGMTAADFARASGRAVRLAADASAPHGHGLGLSIACSLARDHGLSLTIVPERKSGTSFLLAVPLAPGAT